MNQLQVFQNAEFGSVRTLVVDGIPYFVGKDVTDILKYQNGSRDIKRHVDPEDYRKEMVFDGNQQKETILINESGLYSLIISSKQPKAKRFKRWVTSEVLPSIRQHGVYATNDFLERTLEDPEWAIAILQELQAKKKTIAIQSQQIAEMKPKVSYYDLILQNKSLMAISKIAKDYGMSGQAFNKLLHELGVQYKMGKTWLLYQKHASNGYTQSKTHAISDEKSVMHTYWTQKGRLFLYDLLKSKKGLLPVIEREDN